LQVAKEVEQAHSFERQALLLVSQHIPYTHHFFVVVVVVDEAKGEQDANIALKDNAQPHYFVLVNLFISAEHLTLL
jgi:hypothetical protein